MTEIRGSDGERNGDLGETAEVAQDGTNYDLVGAEGETHEGRDDDRNRVVHGRHLETNDDLDEAVGETQGGRSDDVGGAVGGIRHVNLQGRVVYLTK